MDGVVKAEVPKMLVEVDPADGVGGAPKTEGLGALVEDVGGWPKAPNPVAVEEGADAAVAPNEDEVVEGNPDV